MSVKKRFYGVLIDFEERDMGMNGMQAIGSLMPDAGNMRGLVERAAKAQPKREIGRGVVMFYAALCATIGNDAMSRKWATGGVGIEVLANGKVVTMDSGVYMHQRALEQLFASGAGQIDGRDVLLGEFWQAARDTLSRDCKFAPSFSEIKSALEAAAFNAGARHRIIKREVIRSIEHNPTPANFFERGDKKNLWRRHYARACMGGKLTNAQREGVLQILSKRDLMDVWLASKKGINVLSGGKTVADYFFMIDFPIPLLKTFDASDL